MKANWKQTFFSNFFENFNEFVDTKKPMFLKRFEAYTDIKSLISHEFYKKYYSNIVRPRDYSLKSMVLAFLFKCFFSLLNISTLILFLSISYELRSVCGLTSALVTYKSLRQKLFIVPIFYLFC